MRLPLTLLLALTGTLTACTLPQISREPQRPEQRCNAQAAQWAVGKTNTENNVAQARVQAGAYMVRVLNVGAPATREFNAERLNLEVDATGRIVSATCG
ncbi:I78 family peptidase inhibitor [Comamonas nitrativorans]|uniref:I78 family peptidase inhibitor n=1 Tax=Comamonas nitrativorans TaxID=108437 RepID=A0ABV9H1V5_9BURK